MSLIIQTNAGVVIPCTKEAEISNRKFPLYYSQHLPIQRCFYEGQEIYLDMPHVLEVSYRNMNKEEGEPKFAYPLIPQGEGSFLLRDFYLPKRGRIVRELQGQPRIIIKCWGDWLVPTDIPVVESAINVLSLLHLGQEEVTTDIPEEVCQAVEENGTPSQSQGIKNVIYSPLPA